MYVLYWLRSGFSKWYHWKIYQWKPDNPERFSAANGVIGVICETIGTDGIIGMPASANGGILINTSNLFFILNLFVYILVFLLFAIIMVKAVHISEFINHKFKTQYLNL